MGILMTVPMMGIFWTINVIDTDTNEVAKLRMAPSISIISWLGYAESRGIGNYPAGNVEILHLHLIIYCTAVCLFQEKIKLQDRKAVS